MFYESNKGISNRECSIRSSDMQAAWNLIPGLLLLTNERNEKEKSEL